MAHGSKVSLPRDRITGNYTIQQQMDVFLAYLAATVGTHRDVHFSKDSERGIAETSRQL